MMSSKSLVKSQIVSIGYHLNDSKLLKEDVGSEGLNYFFFNEFKDYLKTFDNLIPYEICGRSKNSKTKC